MNYNILSYLIYGCITVYIICYVGKMFYRNGRIFILRLFSQNQLLTDTTNNILLTAYYLFNIGYAVVQLSFWENVTSVATIISSIAHKTGVLVLILAITHYFNLFVIYLLSYKSKQLITFKKIKS